MVHATSKWEQSIFMNLDKKSSLAFPKTFKICQVPEDDQMVQQLKHCNYNKQDENGGGEEEIMPWYTQDTMRKILKAKYGWKSIKNWFTNIFL